MNIVDPVGWSAGRFEWFTLWLLCADDNGVVSKEKIRAQVRPPAGGGAREREAPGVPAIELGPLRRLRP